MLALQVPGRGDFFARVPVKAASGLAGNATVLFIFLRLKIKEFIGLILKSQSHLKTKAERSLGLFSPERTKYWDKVCSAKNDITFGQRLPSWVQGWIFFFFLKARLPFVFFSCDSMWLCLHSLDRVYKYRENGRQNKVSNFISSKNIVPLSSSELTVPSKFQTLCWMETRPTLHHYTVAQAARKYQPFIKSGPVSWSIKGKIKQKSNMRAKLLTDLWLCLLFNN